MKWRLLIAVLLSLATAAGIASIVRDASSARDISYTEYNVPTTADYVQDGLMVMYDAIENAGVGVHDPEATVWTELVGLPYVNCNLPMRDHEILDKGVKCESKLPMARRPANPTEFMEDMSEGYTMQLAVSLSENEMSDGLAGLNANGFYFAAAVDAYGQLFRFSTFQPRLMRATRGFPQFTTLSLAADAVDNYTVFLYGNTVWYSFQSFSTFAADNTFYPAIGINSEGRVHDTYGAGVGNGVIYHNFRIYNRALTPAEIEHNNRIDKARFGL